MWVQSLGGEDPLEEEMAPPSSILAWKSPWTEEYGGLLPMRLQRVGHDCGIEHTYARVCAHTHTSIYLYVSLYMYSIYICITLLYI